MRKLIKKSDVIKLLDKLIFDDNSFRTITSDYEAKVVSDYLSLLKLYSVLTSKDIYFLEKEERYNKLLEKNNIFDLGRVLHAYGPEIKIKMISSGVQFYFFPVCISPSDLINTLHGAKSEKIKKNMKFYDSKNRMQKGICMKLIIPNDNKIKEIVKCIKRLGYPLFSFYSIPCLLNLDDNFCKMIIEFPYSIGKPIVDYGKKNKLFGLNKKGFLLNHLNPEEKDLRISVESCEILFQIESEDGGIRFTSLNKNKTKLPEIDFRFDEKSIYDLYTYTNLFSANKESFMKALENKNILEQTLESLAERKI